MPEEVNLDKGSKRRMRRIRWKHSEVVSVILFTVALIVLSIAVAVWLMFHSFD